MPIFNTSTLYSKIASGSEGGLEFSRFVKTLLTADYHSRGLNHYALKVHRFGGD
ncbi:hypothetical protein [uncultured Roseivirga sp.]|uniref:hypothetical protein n=1 Tax=uncultured Roseivirga sp. TaxID=543088 RepID=UPI0030D93281